MARRVQEPHSVFNVFDEMGLLIGLTRIPGETNIEYKERLSNYLKGRPSSTNQGLVNALSSEFGLSKYGVVDKNFFWLDHAPSITGAITVYIDDVGYGPQIKEVDEAGWPSITGATYGVAAQGWILWRDSQGNYTPLLELIAPPTGGFVSMDYTYNIGDGDHTIRVGDTTLDTRDPLYGLEGRWKMYQSETPTVSNQVVVNALNDASFLFDTDNNLVDASGLPTVYLRNVVDYIERASPITWGRFLWDETYYQENDDSIESLPSLYDAAVDAFVGSGNITDFHTGVSYGDELLVVDVTEVGTPTLHPTGFIFREEH